MKRFTRRELLRTGALGAAGLALSPLTAAGKTNPFIRSRSDLKFRLYPHPLVEDVSFAYATDRRGDPFKSPISIGSEGLVAPEAMSDSPFSVNAQWFVEGFGNVFLEADNAGRYYTEEDFRTGGERTLNMEFARSYVARNQRRFDACEGEGTRFSSEVRGLMDLSAELLEDASRRDGEAAAARADISLRYALWAGEKIELEKARQDIERRSRMEEFFFGCESRQYVWAKSVDMTERFEELFNYATVTHYVYDTWYEVFEPEEGQYRWGIKDNIVDWLTENDITVEGRPLFWFHSWVTPDWLKEKNFSELKQYVERHVENVVGHYGDRVLHWEVVNEYHDWANVHRHTPEQITEITRLACEKTHEVNPRVERLINNCCPYAEYVAHGHFDDGPADRPLRSPYQFMEDLTEAEVPFEIVGLQMYFPNRSIADIVRLVDRFEDFGKPVSITETGTSSGPTREDIMLGSMDVPRAPYDWHRPWDEELQADWMEQLYTVLYSKPFIHSINWYDFADFRTFIPNGGLIKVDGTRKQSFDRMKDLLGGWGRLPDGQ